MSSILTKLESLNNWDGCEFKDYEAVKNLPETVLETLWKSYTDDWESYEKTAKLDEDRKQVWARRCQTETEDGDIDYTPLKKLLDGRVQKRAMKDSGTIIMIPKSYAPLLIELLEQEKERVLTEFDEANKPKPDKPKKKSSRTKFSGETRYTNTKDNPQDKDGKFFFAGDEDAVFEKITYTSPLGTFQNRSYKAVKMNRYLGGSESDPKDGLCCSAVTWDKSASSEAINKTGLSASQFKIRCGGQADSDTGRCKSCMNRNVEAPDFFTDKYNIGRGTGKKYSGVTYCQFIIDNLTYA